MTAGSGRRGLLRLAALGAPALVPEWAGAQRAGFPARLVTIVVPAAAGGGLDAATRQVATRLAQALGAPVVVENRPSVNLLIGTRYVARAAPDGHTLLAISNTFLGAAIFAEDPGYDPFRDFAPVAPVARGPNLLLVNAASGIGSVAELVDRARRSAGTPLTFGSAGAGSSPHVAAVLLARATGIELLDVAYRGAAPALLDLLGGRITMLFDSVSSARPHLAAGTLRALAATTAQRSAVVPEVPTLAEALNLPDYDLPLFYGLAAPAATPPDLVALLHAAISRITADPALREAFAAIGFEAETAADPAAYARFLRDQSERLRGLRG
jgi:tripartite-type tricarboxylate transporter receptor subunit TctC